MDIALQGASKPEELIPLDDPRGHYAFGKIFEKPGWRTRRRNRDRLKLLQNLDGPLSEMLHDGERVTCVAWGTEYSLLEEYFLRVWAHYMNRRALLLTNERILVLQISSGKKLLALKSQLRYCAIKKLKTSWLGMVLITPKQGKRLELARIPGAVRKSFTPAIESLRKSAHVSNVVTREHLCPHCYEPIVELVPACPKCRGTFKSARRARWLSFLFPGAGDLYLGHRWLGGFQVAGGLLVWTTLLAGVGADFDGSAQAATAAAITLAIAFLLLHGVDAWVTGHTASKGLYPENRGLTTG
jgi:hypothetical protein